jgi:hypothetical protein
MSYPGELASFVTNPSGFDLMNSSYTVMDGMLFNANGGNAGIRTNGTNHIVLRHVDVSGVEWGFSGGADSVAMVDYTVEDSVFHDSPGGQHGIYLASHAGLVSKDIFIRRNLLYNQDYTGMQANGRFNNLIQEQNITYSNLVTGWSWTEGVQNSFNLNNVSINDAKGLTMFLYDGNEGSSVCGPSNNLVCNCTTTKPVGSICAWPQINNVIDHLTVYMTGKNATGLGSCNGGSDNACAPAVQVGRQGSGCTTTSCTTSDMGHNTFSNLVLMTNNTNDHYQPIQFPDSTGVTFLGTTTFNNVIYKNGVNTSVLGYGPGSGYGYAGQSCAAAAGLAASFTGCTNADPLFVAASPAYWNAPASFNLRPAPGSPLIAAGLAKADPFDVIGNAFANPPSIGAYEYTGPPPPPSCDINRDGVIDSLDVPAAIKQALGVTPCGTSDLMQNGQCSVVDVQRVINAVMGGSCRIGQ